MAALLVVGAEGGLVDEALERAGEDEDVIVLDPSSERLEALLNACRDPRVWFQIGGADVIPLPDASIDDALGAEPSPELERVRRGSR